MFSAEIRFHLALWKKILLRSIGVGLGLAIGTALILACYAWYSSRPRPQKPWDTNALTATFDYVTTHGDDHHLRFFYVVENHTDSDYTLLTAALVATATMEDGHLSGDNASVNFKDSSLFLPAKQAVETAIDLPDYHYLDPSELARNTPDERKKYDAAVAKYVTEQLRPEWLCSVR